MMEEAKEINSKIKNSRTLKMGGGMMKRPMYKEGSTPTKGNIRHGKLKTQKELKKITDSKEYKKSDFGKKTKMLNVATMATGGRVGLKAGGSDASKFHTKKDGTKARKGLYYYMNRAKKKGTSKPGKGSVTDKALKASAKTAKKPTKKA